MASALQMLKEYEERRQEQLKTNPPPPPEPDHCETVGELIEEHPIVSPRSR